MAKTQEEKLAAKEVETVLEVVKEDSEAKKEYQRIIEAYKIKNPVKYELKKKAFEAKLATL